MLSSRAFAAFVVIGAAFAASDAEVMQKAGELALALHNQTRQMGRQYHQKMSQQRHLQATSCLSDCPGAANASQDGHTVCKMPDRCESSPFADPCISDCQTKMETMIMCETKQFCVDMNKEGACPTTLVMVQGTADYPNAVPCEACKEHSDKLIPFMMNAGFGTMDMDVAKMTMTMTSEDNCPKTKAAAECALANADCLDPTKSSDLSSFFFNALCECPCGQLLAEFLSDFDSMIFDACAKGVKDGFKTPMPGLAETGPLLFNSGVLECLGCADNAKTCDDAFNKWVLDPVVKGTLIGTLAMAGTCNEETTTTTTQAPMTTTEAPSPATSSASGMSYIFSCIIAVFAAVQLV